MIDPLEIRSSAEREFRRLKLVADRALVQVDDRRFFQGIDAHSNTIAIVVKHLAGNMRSRWRNFLTEDGEKPDRDRDGEFVIRPEDTRDALMSAWEEGWALLLEQVSALTPGQMTDNTVVVKGEGRTITQALQRQLSHHSYHVGQLVFLARHLCAQDWEPLSVPLNQSRHFNEEPDDA